MGILFMMYLCALNKKIIMETLKIIFAVIGLYNTVRYVMDWLINKLN